MSYYECNLPRYLQKDLDAFKEGRRVGSSLNADGEKAARWILGILNGTRKRDSLVLGPTYVFGQTLKQADERKHS